MKVRSCAQGRKEGGEKGGGDSHSAACVAPGEGQYLGRGDCGLGSVSSTSGGEGRRQCLGSIWYSYGLGINCPASLQEYNGGRLQDKVKTQVPWFPHCPGARQGCLFYCCHPCHRPSQALGPNPPVPARSSDFSGGAPLLSGNSAFQVNSSGVSAGDGQPRAGSTAHCDRLMSPSHPAPALQGAPQLLPVGKPHSFWSSQIKAPSPRPFLLSLHACRTYFDLTSILTLVFSALASLSCLLRAGLGLTYLSAFPLSPCCPRALSAVPRAGWALRGKVVALVMTMSHVFMAFRTNSFTAIAKVPHPVTLPPLGSSAGPCPLLTAFHPCWSSISLSQPMLFLLEYASPSPG